jgi:hypothetical protein
MTNIPFTPPAFKQSSFNCPICNAFAKQVWGTGCSIIQTGHNPQRDTLFSHCSHCGNYSIWHDSSMIYPDSSQAPLPNPDLPDDIKKDYEEARQIINRSPRGAAALLRLCIQKLCLFLGESGTNINNDIAALVKKGLNPKIQKSLDIVRVIGNEAVHPGAIDLRDNIDVAVQLCKIINIVAEAMITQPKLIDDMYSALPEDKKKQIDKRDST